MISIHELQQHQRQCQDDIHLSEALERLQHNSDFKKVINEFYLKKFVILKSYELSCCHKQSDEFEHTQNQLIAVGLFKSFLDDILQRGQLARISLQESKLIPESEIHYE